MYDRVVRRHVFQTTKQGDAARHFYVIWFMLTGAVASAAGVSADNGFIALPGLWLLVCAAFFTMAGNSWWGDQTDASGAQVYS
jgi:hypothetical protein